MATAVARVAFAADSGGGGSSKAPKVAAAINAAFGRFADPAKTSLFIGGDEYSVCNASTMKHYDKYLTQPNISPARCVMTPGNHTNGPGGASNIPDVSAWLSYNAARGTKSRTDGGWINRSQGIPMTDQYVDVAGIRFIFLNSGACENVVDKPGWPVPHTGGSVAGNARGLAAVGLAAGDAQRRHHAPRALELLRRRPRQPDDAEPDRRDHGQERRHEPAQLADPAGARPLHAAHAPAGGEGHLPGAHERRDRPLLDRAHDARRAEVQPVAEVLAPVREHLGRRLRLPADRHHGRLQPPPVDHRRGRHERDPDEEHRLDRRHRSGYGGDPDACNL